MQILRVFMFALMTGLFALPSALVAQSMGDRYPFEEAARPGAIRIVFDDAATYAMAPLHWNEDNWIEFGAAIVTIGVAHHYDERVRSHFVSGSQAALDRNSTNDLRDALPAAAIFAVTLASANLLNEDAGRKEAYTMLEAGIFSSVAAELFKYAAGRERPSETANADRWRRGGASFPSLHATAAFAIGTVLAESGNDEYRWVRRVLGYGIAAATGYERVKSNDHWMSDVLAGAALGGATAAFLIQRHEPGHERNYSWQLLPIDGGAILQVNAQLAQPVQR